MSVMEQMLTLTQNKIERYPLRALGVLIISLAAAIVHASISIPLPTVTERDLAPMGQVLMPKAPNRIELFLISQIEQNSKNISKQDVQLIAQAIIEESQKHQIDPLLILSIMKHESRMDAQAKGRHGEIGLMQVLPRTARWISRKAGISYQGKSDLKNPVKNIQIGVAYLVWLKGRLGTLEDYISAYNMGYLNVRRLKAKGLNPQIYFNKVNQVYVAYQEGYRVYGELDATSSEQVAFNR